MFLKTNDIFLTVGQFLVPSICKCKGFIKITSYTAVVKMAAPIKKENATSSYERLPWDKLSSMAEIKAEIASLTNEEV